MFTTEEQKKFKAAKKAWNYYNDDFVTDYPKKGTIFPLGRTAEDTLVFDNWVSKTVNRYAASAIGKYASVEVEDEDLQNFVNTWHEEIDFESKMTSIARYQGLYGYAVVKLVFDMERDEEGAVVVAGKNVADILSGIKLAVFGADKAVVRHDEYGNVDSILITIGNRIEQFFNDRVDIYERANAGAAYKLTSSQPNPIAPSPLAFVVKNLETGIVSNSDVQGILTLQESLNDALTASRLNAHYHGFPTYTATGFDFARDDKGDPVPLVMGAGMTLLSEKADTEFGRIEAADASQTIATVENNTKVIAVQTNSLSLLTGQIPSGTALSYMLTDFNSAVSEKQSKLKAFMVKVHKSVFKIVDYALNTNYKTMPVKAFAAGYNPIQAEMEYQQALSLYAVKAVSLKTLLETSAVVNDTQEELDRLAEEAATAPADDTTPFAGLLRE